MSNLCHLQLSSCTINLRRLWTTYTWHWPNLCIYYGTMCIISDGKDILSLLIHVPLNWQFSYMYIIVVNCASCCHINFISSETHLKGHYILPILHLLQTSCYVVWLVLICLTEGLRWSLFENEWGQKCQFSYSLPFPFLEQTTQYHSSEVVAILAQVL